MLTPKTNALVRHRLIDWLGQVPMSWTTAGRVKWHSWNRTTGLSLSWNYVGLHEASAFMAPISLGFLFFEIYRSCFTDLLNHPVTHICTLAIKIFAFLLSQHRQEAISSALVPVRDACCGRRAARDSEIKDGYLRSLCKMLQGTAIIKIINTSNNNY